VIYVYDKGATPKKTEGKNMKPNTMTYKQLEQKVIANRAILRTTKDLDLKRRLIAENHSLMTEMDSRWNRRAK
jgi:hypothetical protein